MQNRQSSIFSRIMPFVYMGIAAVFVIFAIIIGLYILFYGAIIGLILFAIAYVKSKFFDKSSPRSSNSERLNGQTYDNDEFDR